MAIEVTLPGLGESVTDGTITRWLKQVGDSVAVDEPLVEISTDKVDTQVPSPAAGTLLEIRAGEDQTVEVGSVLAVIGEQAATTTSADPGLPDATNAVRTHQSPNATPVATPAAAPQPVSTGSTMAVATTHAARPSALRGTTQKMSRLRKTIATRMVNSLQTSAQLTSITEVDLTLISNLRAEVKDGFAEREGVKLTYLPFLIKAAVATLRIHPKLNATIDAGSEEIHYPATENVSIAVDTDKGLMVPVIKDAGDLSVAELARRIADIAERTRANKLTPDDVSGGTFTVSNTGGYGTLMFTPILNQPQVAILGTGAVVKRPMVISEPSIGDTIAIRDMMYLSLTYDHRLVDGAESGRFLRDLKARLERGEDRAEFGEM